MQKLNVDNRDYSHAYSYNEIRMEYPIISKWIEPNSKVIDLGCGDGALLQSLKQKKNISEVGLDVSEKAIELCRQKNVNAFCASIDSKLEFEDNSFDYSICNVTIQMVKYPEILLFEMKRISKYQIISFPNFAFYKNRFELLFKGRMPTRMLYNYSWYNTGHIHQLSIIDFKYLVSNIGGIRIKELDFYKSGNVLKNYLMETFPNLFLQIPIYLLSKYD